MNEAIYLETLKYKIYLQVYCVERSNVPADKLREIGNIYQKIFGEKKINYGCKGCVDEVMHGVYNLLKAYENTISK